jgi:uncharacterized membrane protein YjgN (DUF898 family)
MHMQIEPTFDQAATQPLATQTMRHELDIRFTGSGSEYFRIWIVNLLLTIVTLSLYYPWAKVRKLKYFYGNTLVGGQPLGFHADPKKMLRGYLLVALLLLLYSVSGHFSPTAGLVALVIVAAIWPALLKSSMQFRLANTSWRGLRFRFHGSVSGAYAAILPLFVPALLLGAMMLGVPDEKNPPAWFGGAFFGVFALTMLLLPWFWFKLKKYQHDHLGYGPEQTALNTGAGSFYGVFMKTSLVSVLGIVAFGLLAGLLAAGVFGLAVLGNPRSNPIAMAIFVIVLGLFALLVVQLMPRPYFTSRMQNLAWGKTASTNVSFASALRFRPLLWLTIKNWLLMVLTLGLYWPFAAVATTRMRLEATRVLSEVDPQTLSDRTRAGEGEAAGDAAGDLFGLDIGL